MKRALYALSILFASTPIARCEDFPGYRFPVEIRLDEEVVRDAPEKSSVLLRIPNAPFGKQEISILFETKSRKVLRAVWMTKGGSPLQLPRTGITLPPKPAQFSHPVVVLSARDLGEADPSKIALLGVVWTTVETE